LTSPGYRIAVLLTLVVSLFAAEDLLVVAGTSGHAGGGLEYSQRTEPKTLNPAFVGDNPSREVIHRLIADLIHINRESQMTEPALAKSWKVSPDGLRYTLELRRGVRFSDGEPFDADDVIFSFQVYLDEKLNSPQRDLLIIDGKPIQVRKLDAYRVQVDLPRQYAAAERLFDGLGMLPRHLLEKLWREGKLADAWNLRTPPAEMAGLGPFRVKIYVPGQRIELTRNPYYWKADKDGTRLPYLDTVTYRFAGTEDMQVMQFQSGESDILNRVGARNYAVLEKDRERRGYALRDLGPGLEYAVMVFNLNDVNAKTPPGVAAHEAFLANPAFRQAVSQAIDRDSMVRLVYQGHAAPLASPLPLGNKNWIDRQIPAPVRSVAKAREALRMAHFTWTPDGVLKSPEGHPVEFSILASAGNAERVQMAGLIQDDLKALGMEVHVATMDTRSLLNRVQRTHDYDACLLTLQEADADPTPDMSVLLSNGSTHLWHPDQKSPATAWEAEIDRLMQQQMVTPEFAARKRLFDRVQELMAVNLPMIPLVSPNILVGSKGGLGNFRPAVLDHYTLWNVEELYWRKPNPGAAR
jgi:peptide/nickel transport system substrate-binding protein